MPVSGALVACSNASSLPTLTFTETNGNLTLPENLSASGVAINGISGFASLDLTNVYSILELNITDVLDLERIIGIYESSYLAMRPIRSLNVQTGRRDYGVVNVAGYGFDNVSLADSGPWSFENSY